MNALTLIATVPGDRFADAVKTEDATEIGSIILDALKKCVASTTPRAMDDREINDRIAALIKAREVAPIYRAAYPDDARIDLALQGCADYISGRLTPTQMGMVRIVAASALSDAAHDAETCPRESVTQYWSASDAAEVVVAALRPRIDFDEISSAAEAATKWAPKVALT